MKRFLIDIKPNCKYVVCYEYDNTINIIGFHYLNVALKEYYYFKQKCKFYAINTINKVATVNRIIECFVERCDGGNIK